MTKTSKRGLSWISEASTQTLQNVLRGRNLEHEAQPERYPLADRAQISGVGQVFHVDIQNELDARDRNASPR